MVLWNNTCRQCRGGAEFVGKSVLMSLDIMMFEGLAMPYPERPVNRVQRDTVLIRARRYQTSSLEVLTCTGSGALGQRDLFVSRYKPEVIRYASPVPVLALRRMQSDCSVDKMCCRTSLMWY